MFTYQWVYYSNTASIPARKKCFDFPFYKEMVGSTLWLSLSTAWLILSTFITQLTSFVTHREWNPHMLPLERFSTLWFGQREVAEARAAPAVTISSDSLIGGGSDLRRAWPPRRRPRRADSDRNQPSVNFIRRKNGHFPARQFRLLSTPNRSACSIQVFSWVPLQSDRCVLLWFPMRPTLINGHYLC